MDKIAGGFIIIAVGFYFVLFSARMARNQAAALRAVTTDRGKRLTKMVAVVAGLAWAYGGARLVLGYASAGGAPYPDGAPNRAADYFVGGVMLVAGLSLAIFRRHYAEYLAGEYRCYAEYAERDGRTLFRILPIMMGLALLAIGIALVTGQLGRGPCLRPGG